MRTVFPSLGFSKKYSIDFSLIPLGVIFLELSVLTTEIGKARHRTLGDLLLMRLLHTLTLMAITLVLSQTLKRMKIRELSYPTIAFTGLCVISVGIYLHRILASYFEIEVISLHRNVMTGLLQGLFWFPAFILIGSKRTEIFGHFREYEKRLLVATRALSRNSDEFREIQIKIQNDIRSSLIEKCNALRNAINGVNLDNVKISVANAQIQPLLVGEDLRSLSMNLETFGSEQSQTTILGQNVYSVRLLANQFKILYETTSKAAPLKARTYAGILLILITPAYINYFTWQQTLISYPLVALAIFLSSKLITKELTRSSVNTVRNSSLLIYLTGVLPLISNLIGQSINPDPNTRYPIFIGALTLPLGYLVFMKVLQVLQPHALDLIKKDELVASKELRDAVTKIVSDEFSHTLSHRWAIYIHGKILTRLAATSLKLETAKNAEDLKTYQDTISSLSELLSNPDSEFEKAETDLDSEIASRLDPWLGLLDIELEIDHDLKTIRSERVRDIGEVIEEIISNSMRHGKANEVNLRVRNLGDKNIEIIAVDNATIEPPMNQIRFGLGTRIFNLASDSRWSITRVNSTTVFKLIMAIE